MNERFGRFPRPPRKRGEGWVCERLTPEQAEEYCARIMADAEALADYERVAEERECSARDVILQDALTPPIIDRIDLSGYTGCPGDVIKVWASDDFFLLGVDVVIEDGREKLFESGCADEPEDEGAPWIYRATTTLEPGQLVEIHFLAVDGPCNMTTKMELFRRDSGAS